MIFIGIKSLLLHNLSNLSIFSSKFTIHSSIFPNFFAGSNFARKLSLISSSSLNKTQLCPIHSTDSVLFPSLSSRTNVALSLIYVEIKNSVFKKLLTDISTNFWTVWEFRFMIIVSVILQFVLVISGNLRRGYIGKKMPCVEITVWLVYLSADWVATIALSTLLRGKVYLGHDLIVCWTPFLLWHLGSPHNITAYSLADNEMWLRHFFAMVIRVLEAIYIFVRFWTDCNLGYIAVPILIAGIFKYGERIWALRSASEEQLINSFYSFYREASNEVNPEQRKKMIRIGLPESEIDSCCKNEVNVLNLLREAYSSFIIFKPLFLGLPFGISAKYYDKMVDTIKSISAEEAFKLVGTELGYLYDMFFTKMPIHHGQGKVSLHLRVFCFLCAVTSLICFIAFVDKSHHLNVDIVITYLLLLGAICLDIYSFIMHALSTWAMVRMTNPENKVDQFYNKVAAWRSRSVEAKMGIKSMAQHDLIIYYVKAKTNKFKDAVIRLIDTRNLLQKYGHTNWESVDRELKQFIYSHLEKKHRKLKENNFGAEVLENLLNGKAENALQEPSFPGDDLELDTADFTERIFIWHFATELVYYDDVDSFRRGALGSYCQIAKSLSDYMMYLVLVRPSMLSKGFSDVINKHNYNQVNCFFKPADQDNTKIRRKKDFTELRKEFTSAVLQYEPEIPMSGDSIGVINDGRRFSQILKGVVTEAHWDHEEKWEMISKVWMEMMVHAASHCSWKEHAQQLRHGGEMLTHVALLMAHLGLTTQIHRDEARHDEDQDRPPKPF